MKKHLAALLGATLAAGGLTVASPAEAATPPSEVKVVPAPTFPSYEFPTDSLAVAGRTGFLHRRTATSPWLWTRYADRHTVVVDALNGLSLNEVTGLGGDLVRTPVLANDTKIHTLDLRTMTWRDLARPTGGTWRVVGDTVVVARYATDPLVELRHPAADGTYTTSPVTDIPEGATLAQVLGGDDRGAVLRFNVPGAVRYGLIDPDSGKIAMMPELGVVGRAVLTDNRIGLVTSGKVWVFSRAGVADGTDIEPTVFTIPVTTDVNTVALAGDDLIVVPPRGSNDQSSVLRYPADGGPPAQIGLAPSNAYVYLRQAQDGALFVGGTKSSDWSVRKVTGTDQSVVLSLTGPQFNAGVTLSAGLLRHVSAMARPGEKADFRFYENQITPGTGPAPHSGGDQLVNPIPCAPNASCVRTVGGYYRGPSYLAAGSPISLRSTTSEILSGVSLPSADGVVVDASDNYRLVNGINPARQYLVDSYDKIVSTTAVTGAALWSTTLWAATKAGTLQSKNVKTGATGVAVSTGSACTASEVQATGKHLLWTCGVGGAAGVYDLQRKTNIPVPAGQYLLGDNYLVRHDASGALLRYDLTDGTLGSAVTVATLPRGDLPDDRNISWAVDKFGGDVAWVDENNAVHIVDPGVAPSAPVALTVSTSTELMLPGVFSVSTQLSRPVDGARLTLTEARTGKVIAGTPDGAARDYVSTSWDGMADGNRATRGTYRWTMTVSADGSSTAIASGTVYVTYGGTPVFHGYEASGRPNLLGLTSAATGAGQWLSVQPGGTALARSGSQTESLTPVTAIVPFGDISKDLRNDLLIRRADGSMRAFRGDDGVPFTGNTLTAVAGNWNRWDVLVHTGDLTGDGQSDLIARDRATGGLYHIDGDGKGGFKTPVLWANGYRGYTRFVGPGDINGDGKADLLLFVGTDMYAKYGDGKGGLGDRRLVGSGFLGYNAIVGAGDLNEDGKNDLLLRDTAGNLYRRLGDGKGNFGNRLLVGVGYQKFAGIY